MLRFNEKRGENLKMQWLVLCMRKQPHKYIRSKIGCKYISGIHVPSFISIYSVCISIMVMIIMKLSLLYLSYSSPCTFPDFNDFCFPQKFGGEKIFSLSFLKMTLVTCNYIKVIQINPTSFVCLMKSFNTNQKLFV